MAGSKETETMKAWGGRFGSAPDRVAESFTASILFDNRMVLQDIRGSVAHVRMLGRQGIIPVEDANSIENGLWMIWDEAEAGTFAFSVADEDIHTAVERRVRELIGPVQGKLHTARSRNDQVATDTRMWTKQALLDLAAKLQTVVFQLSAVAQAHVDVIMPGYTHTQRAQPVLFAHHMHAYVEMFLRDLDRVEDAFRRTNRMPLGSGALAGVTYPINRESVAKDLGFGDITANSMDAIADRDYILDSLFLLSLVQVHISRLSEELIYWSSGEFRFIEISDAFATGSSIMPQKKNADVAELSRGRSGRVFGHLSGLLAVMKGLPLTYNSDMQEDKEALFDAFDTVYGVLDVMAGMVSQITVNADRMKEAATGDFSLATDAADLLARNGVPFREAHEVVGRLVRMCIDEGLSFDELTAEQWVDAHPLFADQLPPLTALASVESRDVPGGTAPVRVVRALADAEGRASEIAERLTEESQTMAEVMSRNSTGPSGANDHG